MSMKTKQRTGHIGNSQRKNYPLQFLVPAFLVLLIFYLVPTVYNFIYAFTDWSSFKSEIHFNGWDNFKSLTESGQMLSYLRITFIYAVLVALFQNVFGLCLALLLERDTRINRAIRSAFFVPVIMSALAVGYVFQAILKPDGALNSLISFFTPEPVSIPWLGSNTWTLVVVALIHAWKWMGLTMLIFLAGLKTINPDVLEAARLDGVSRWQMFRYIRFPLLAPAFTFNVVTALLGSMNGFDVVLAATKGGPGGSTKLLNLYIYETFGQGLWSQATAMSLVLFLSILIIAIPVIKYLRKREGIL